jgi:hypothetical protein
LLSQELLLLLLLLLNHGGSIFSWLVTRNERQLWLGWWIGVCVCGDCLVLVGIRRRGSLGRIGGRRRRGIKVQLQSFSSLFGTSGLFFFFLGFAAGFDDVSRELAAAIGV